MIIQAGIANDKREIKIELPPQHRRIGMMLSGGADSAILLYLLALENKAAGWTHDIQPLTVPRTDGAWDYVAGIIGWVNNRLGVHIPPAISVGDPSVHHSQQTNTGEREGRDRHGIEHIFYGSQQHPPVPMPGEYPGRPDRNEYTNNQGIVTTTCPFALLDKRHTLDLYIQFDCFGLLAITHSCTERTQGRCGACYNCVERAWALAELDVSDSGSM
jgi:hypothetical protein